MFYFKYYAHHNFYSVVAYYFKMEEHLRKLVEHAEPQRSHQFIISGREAKITRTFQPPLTLPSKCYYEMAVHRLETYYSFANIKPENSNFRLSIDGGKTWKLLSIPTGCYEITAINETLQRLIESSGGKAKVVDISPNVNTLKCILDITNENYQIDFTVDNCLRTVLGFAAKIYKHGRYESDKLVDILNINSILVHCDIVGASRLNGIEAPIIYNFFPNVAPGEKIVETPTNLIYVPIIVDTISSLTCWLTDQDGNNLDLRGEVLTISLHARAC